MNSRRIHVVSFGLALLLGIAGLSGCATRSPYHDEVARSREAERIRETLQKYAIFLDDGRVEDFLDLFTQVAVFTADEFVYEGRESIRVELAEKARGLGKHLPPGRDRDGFRDHRPRVVRFSAREDRARRRSDLLGDHEHGPLLRSPDQRGGWTLAIQPAGRVHPRHEEPDRPRAAKRPGTVISPERQSRIASLRRRNAPSASTPAATDTIMPGSGSSFSFGSSAARTKPFVTAVSTAPFQAISNAASSA